MGKVIRLDTSITDLNAPKLAHSAGAAGWIARYIGGHINLAPEALVNTLVNVRSGYTLNPFVSPSSAVLKNDATKNNLRYVQFDSAGNARAQFNSAEQLNVPAVSTAMVVKSPTGTGVFSKAAGTGWSRAGNGQWQMSGATGGIYTGAVTSDWSLLIGVSNGASSAVNINGTAATGTTTTASSQLSIGPYNSNPGPSVAEYVVWDRALTADEILAVRTALKSKYSFLP